jgi:hypothetical protein
MRKRFSVLLLAFATTGLLASIGGSETQQPEAPKTDLQKFHHAVIEISAHTTNAGSKLKHGAVSMDSGDAPATVARMCCGNNIDVIKKQFEVLATSMRNLRACYRANENTDGEILLNLVYQDAGSLSAALGNFSNASRADVHLGYGAVVKSVLLLRKSAKELTECQLP